MIDQGAILPEGSVAKDNKGPKAKTHIVPVEKMSDNNNNSCEKRLSTNILFNLLIFRHIVQSHRPTAYLPVLLMPSILACLPYF